MTLRQRLACIACALAMAHARAASFDCAKAATYAEKTVCATPELSRMDEALQADYARVKALNPILVSGLQKTWLTKTRDACTDVECLRRAYRRQSLTLVAVGVAAARALDTTGAYVRYAEGRPDRNGANLKITRVDKDRYHLEGDALWSRPGSDAPNEGAIDGDFDRVIGPIQFTSGHCTMTLLFAWHALTVSDCSGDCGGNHVTWDGDYRLSGT